MTWTYYLVVSPGKQPRVTTRRPTSVQPYEIVFDLTIRGDAAWGKIPSWNNPHKVEITLPNAPTVDVAAASPERSSK